MIERSNSYSAKRSRLNRKLYPMTEQQKEQRKAYMRAYYLANREQLLAYQREVRKLK